MNFMIDGAYGDLYRRAIGHPQLLPAVDEWEIERRLGSQPRRSHNSLKGLLQRVAGSLISTVRTKPRLAQLKETAS